MAVQNNKTFIDKILIILSVIYIFVSFGLSGLPEISRLSFVSALLMGLFLLINKRKLIFDGWVFVLIILYFYLILPSFFASFIPYDTINGTITVFLGTICISLLLNNEVLSKKVFAYIVLCAALANVAAVMAGIDTTPLVYRGSNELRATGFLGNANTFAVNLCLAGYVVWMVDEVPLFFRFASLSSVIYGIAVSGSRKGVVIGMMLFLFILVRQIKGFSKGKVVSFAFICFSVAYYFAENIINIISMLFDDVYALQRLSLMMSGQETSFSERKWLYNIGVKIWQDSPLFGEGLGQFAYISRFGAYSHNNYIELLVSGGILAFALYYMLYAFILYNSYRFNRSLMLYSTMIVATLLLADAAMVSFVARSNMLFVAFALCYFSRSHAQVSGLKLPKALS